MPSLFSALAAEDRALIDEPFAPLHPFPRHQRLALPLDAGLFVVLALSQFGEESGLRSKGSPGSTMTVVTHVPPSCGTGSSPVDKR